MVFFAAEFVHPELLKEPFEYRDFGKEDFAAKKVEKRADVGLFELGLSEHG